MEKIILTTVFVALGIGGFVLSTLWSYSTHLTLKDAKTDQTKLIIKNLLYLFIIGMELLNFQIRASIHGRGPQGTARNFFEPILVIANPSHGEP